MPMTERGDSTTSVEEYLQYMCDHAGADLEEITDRDIGEGILEPDFRSQLFAIRIVLERKFPDATHSMAAVGLIAPRVPVLPNRPVLQGRADVGGKPTARRHG